MHPHQRQELERRIADMKQGIAHNNGEEFESPPPKSRKPQRIEHSEETSSLLDKIVAQNTHMIVLLWIIAIMIFIDVAVPKFWFSQLYFR